MRRIYLLTIVFILSMSPRCHGIYEVHPYLSSPTTIGWNSYTMETVTIHPDATMGGWTTNTFAARKIADEKHIPCVLVLTQGWPCYSCLTFNNYVFMDKRFQEFISKSGYVGVYNSDGSGGFRVPHKYEQLKWQGGGASPRFACYWNRKDGTIVDAFKNSICGQRTDPLWYIQYLTERIGEYTKEESPVPVPQSTQPIVTNIVTNTVSKTVVKSVAKISDYNVITIDHPHSITEGDKILLKFTRSGSSNSDLTIHVLVNGAWYSSIRWEPNEYSEKRIYVNTSITSEFDDGRTLQITVESLKGAIYN